MICVSTAVVHVGLACWQCHQHVCQSHQHVCSVASCKRSLRIHCCHQFDAFWSRRHVLLCMFPPSTVKSVYFFLKHQNSCKGFIKIFVAEFRVHISCCKSLIFCSSVDHSCGHWNKNMRHWNTCEEKTDQIQKCWFACDLLRYAVNDLSKENIRNKANSKTMYTVYNMTVAIQDE